MVPPPRRARPGPQHPGADSDSDSHMNVVMRKECTTYAPKVARSAMAPDTVVTKSGKRKNKTHKVEFSGGQQRQAGKRVGFTCR